MTQAEKRALELYPEFNEDDNDFDDPCGVSVYSIRNHLRCGFIQGYEKAEEDLAFNWKDVQTLKVLLMKYTDELIESNKWTGGYSKNDYREIAKRFNELKKK